MEIQQETIDEFKSGISKLSVALRKKWAKTLAKSQKVCHMYKGSNKNCYCAGGALLACQRKLTTGTLRNSVLLTDQVGQVTHGLIVHMNDNCDVPFSLFRKWINETLPSNS